MSRDPTKVIDAMLEHIPESHTELRAELGRLRSNACYTAPELMGGIWARMGQALASSLPFPPTEDWQLKVAEIMQGRALEQGLES